MYGNICDKAADKLPDTADYTLGDILRAGDLLISFNYDTLVERLASRSRQLRMVCSSHAADVIWVAKPHGSTSWCMDFDNRSLTSQEPDGRPRLDSLDEGELERKREPLVLGAVPIKSELIREVQEHYGWPSVYEVVTRQWRSVIAALRDAERFFVLGYSFPEEDQYGRFLFREGMRLREEKPEKRPLAVEYYELPEKAAATARSIVSALGSKGLEVTYRDLVTAAPRP